MFCKEQFNSAAISVSFEHLRDSYKYHFIVQEKFWLLKMVEKLRNLTRVKT